jgi:hypothetical protein
MLGIGNNHFSAYAQLMKSPECFLNAYANGGCLIQAGYENTDFGRIGIQ